MGRIPFRDASPDSFAGACLTGSFAADTFRATIKQKSLLMTTRTPITLSPELQQIIGGLAEAERRDPEEVLKDALAQYEAARSWRSWALTGASRRDAIA
jgi:hypothetical protein